MANTRLYREIKSERKKMNSILKKELKHKRRQKREEKKNLQFEFGNLLKSSNNTPRYLRNGEVKTIQPATKIGTIEIWVDGSCKWDYRYQPLDGTCSAYIKIDGEFYKKGKWHFDNVSNNMMEYYAIYLSLKLLIDTDVLMDRKVIIYTDSEISAGTYNENNRFKIKDKMNENLAPIKRATIPLLEYFDDLEVVWIPRDNNSICDTLCTDAYVLPISKSDILPKYVQSEKSKLKYSKYT